MPKIARKQNKPRPTQYEATAQSNLLKRWKRESAGSAHALASFAVINSAGRVTREQYLTSMLDMDEKYPGRGWKQQENELEAIFLKDAERLNRDFTAHLKEIPRGHGITEISTEILADLATERK